MEIYFSRIIILKVETMLKKLGVILVSLFLIISCSNKPAKLPDKMRLHEGTFHTNKWKHSDTIVFLSKKPKSIVRGWSELVWRVTKDSIVREDSRGLNSKANCTYTLKSDFLTLKYQSEQGSGFDKYKVLKITQEELKLVGLEESFSSKEANSIRSDIQLR